MLHFVTKGEESIHVDNPGCNRPIKSGPQY